VGSKSRALRRGFSTRAGEPEPKSLKSNENPLRDDLTLWLLPENVKSFVYHAGGSAPSHRTELRRLSRPGAACFLRAKNRSSP
jgi:hypothetical protein